MTLFDQVTDFGNLYRSYKAAARGKHDRVVVLRHDYHIEKILWRLKTDLESGRRKLLRERYIVAARRGYAGRVVVGDNH